jgi:hypothetical protein
MMWPPISLTTCWPDSPDSAIKHLLQDIGQNKAIELMHFDTIAAEAAFDDLLMASDPFSS